MQPLHILIADDETIEHFALRNLLQGLDLPINLVLEEREISKISQQIKEHSINFLILDINFKGVDAGKVHLPELRKAFPQLKILVVSRQSTQMMFNAVARYANGVMSKADIELQDFQAAIRHIWQGKLGIFHCKATKSFLEGFAKVQKFQLDNRERKYVSPFAAVPRPLLKQVAADLGIDQRRLSEELDNIAVRFGVDNYKTLIDKLIEYGLI